MKIHLPKILATSTLLVVFAAHVDAGDTLKKAVLDLARESTIQYRAAGETELANQIEQQTELVTANPDWGKIRAVPENILVPVPEWSGNPCVELIIEHLTENLSKPDAEFKLGRAGAEQFIHGNKQASNPLQSRIVGDELRLYAWVGLHSQSPLRGNPEAIKRALRRADAYVNAYLETVAALKAGESDTFKFGDMSINDFFACYSMLDGMLMLKHGCQDLVLPIQKRRWDRAAREMAEHWSEYCAKQGGGWWSAEHPRGLGSFCNHHITESMNAQLAGMYLGSDRYTATAQRVIEMQKQSLYPDGAISYIRKQNECFNYHGVNIEKLIRQWELTGFPPAMELLVGSRNYYPISVEPGNVSEYWSAPEWKNMWSAGGFGAWQEIVAGVTKCPFNKAIAKQELRYEFDRGHPHTLASYMIAAPYFDSSIKAAPLLSDYIVFDRNIQGTRSRFGRFSGALVGRNYGNDDTGKMTFAGCMVTDEIDHRRHPLNAALMAVYPRVRFEDTGQNWRDCAYLSHDEKNSMCAGKNFGSLATSHFLARSNYGQVVLPTSWQANQQWLSLPDRIVGLVEVFPGTEELKAMELTGRIRLGYGRHGPLRPKELVKIDDRNYRYGDLKVRIHAHNYASLYNEISGIKRDDGRRATEIVLGERHDSRGPQRVYDGETRRFFSVEVMPDWAEPAESVRIIHDRRIRGLDVESGNKHYLLVHNTSDKTDVFTTDLAGWSTNNRIAKFVGNSGTLVTPLVIDHQPRVELKIPGQTHIVLVGSLDPTDTESGLYDFGALIQ